MSAPRLVVRSTRYSEGVVVAGERLFFSLTRASQIQLCDLSREPRTAEVWAHVPGANGHAIDESGAHIVMSSTGAILRLDESGRIVKVLATEADGAGLIYPNDVALDPFRGGCFCTDSGYTTTPEHIDGTPRGRVVRVDADDRVRVVAGGLAYANGIALAPDGATLYVGESTTRTISRYPVRDDGSLGARALVAVAPELSGTLTVPDGITVASNGRLFVAHYGAGEVLVYEPDGRLVSRLPAGNRATSHVAFDREETTAYVSGGIESEDGEGAIFAIVSAARPHTS
jgi:gluconolactonase